MSAFLCSNLHTVTLAEFILRRHTFTPSTESVAAIARALRKVNNRALKCRYGDTARYLPRDISLLHSRAVAWLDAHNKSDIHALAKCFDYQCQKGDAPNMSQYVYVSEALKYSETSLSSPIWAI